MLNPISIILASNSPRRRELLSLTGWSFISLPADINESPKKGEKPDVYVTRLAREKALACRADLPGIVLAADTIVVHDNQLLGKPGDAADARHMLMALRGRDHTVMTAICLLDTGSGQLEEELCVSTVPMRSYSDQELEEYVMSGDPLDKAGAYAIQHAGFHPVENFHGCFASVMGLPLCHLKRLAARFGLSVSSNMVQDCEKSNLYLCPIHCLVEEGAAVG